MLSGVCVFCRKASTISVGVSRYTSLNRGNAISVIFSASSGDRNSSSVLPSSNAVLPTVIDVPNAYGQYGNPYPIGRSVLFLRSLGFRFGSFLGTVLYRLLGHLGISLSVLRGRHLLPVPEVLEQDGACQDHQQHQDVYHAADPVGHEDHDDDGPIIRYNTIAEQLVHRAIPVEVRVAGFRRFAIGLGKKVLIANTLAVLADEVFAMDYLSMASGTAWMGILAYTFQIYFDFSGYSDMAIGIGQMLGFQFSENFNAPYISQSISEFWRRWHITLGGFMKE